MRSQMEDYKKEEKLYGADDRIVRKKMDAMIACKEMAESILGEPISLRKDGKVTVGI